MSNQSVFPLPSEDHDLPPIPPVIVTMDGQLINTTLSDVWEVKVSRDGGGTFFFPWPSRADLATPQRCFSERAWLLTRLYAADRLARKNAGTVKADYTAVLALDRWLATQGSAFLPAGQRFHWSDYTEEVARAFLVYGMGHLASKGRYFSSLRVLYRWGVVRGYPDFSPQILRILESIKAGGNEKGHHVRFRDPLAGPFSPDEKRWIKQALTLEKGRREDRAIVLLHYELGLNPAATARLKNKDLHHYHVGAETFYQLDVPRVKKRTAGRETKRRPISQQLGLLLEQVTNGDVDAPLYHWLSLRDPEGRIRTAMWRFCENADLRSSTTGERLNMTPRRFRYTLATHMAEEGASHLHIAEILDHTDLQSVGVYTETTSLIAEPVARATDKVLVPLVHRFLGKMVESFSAQAEGGMPNQMIPGAVPHIPSPALNVGAVGMCGRDVRKDGLCKLFPPLSCYLCPSFAALRKGPHLEMLQSIEAHLQENREQIDTRILLQLEELLTAIREVLAQVQEPQVEEEHL